jgi:uncharacterized membrane protein YeaQ/YmgE (transglycosylase-associated protein family)
MDLINLLSWLLFGLIVGAVARVIVPSPHPIGCAGTIAVGVLGSFLGGYLASLLSGSPSGGFRPANFLGAVLGGIIVLGILHLFPRRRM